MPYRVIDKLTQNPGDDWVEYLTQADWEANLIVGSESTLAAFLDWVSEENPGSLTAEQKASLLVSLTDRVINVFDVNEQSITRTTDFEDQSIYQAYQSAVEGLSKESLETKYPYSRVGFTTRTVISEEHID